MKVSTFTAAACLAAGQLLTACAAPDDGVEPDLVSLDQQAPEAAEPAPADVAAAQAYLQSYGYLPSDELLAERPGIEFLVDHPFTSGLLDQSTRDALRVFQARSGLEATGALDAATQTLMARARCGNPDAHEHGPFQEMLDSLSADSGADGESQQKFALQQKLTRGSATVRVVRYPDGSSSSTRAAIDADIESASREFRNRSGMQFLPTTSATIPNGSWQVQVWFYSGAGPTNKPADCPNFSSDKWKKSLAVVASSFYVSSGESNTKQIPLCVNTGKTFMYGSAWDPNAFDFRMVVTHELGHAAGLGHSSIGGAMMEPFIGEADSQTSLAKDDLQALWARWGSFAEMSNSSRTIDLTNSQNASRSTEMWAILENQTIWKRVATGRNQTGAMSGTWTQLDGAATRVAHDGTRAWVVNSAGQTFWRNDADNGWNMGPGCARDIAGFDVNGWWFIAGCDGNLYMLSGNTASFHSGFASPITRLSFDRRKQELWVVLANGQVHKGLNSFTQMPGPLKDVEVGTDGTIWGIGTNDKPRIYNSQARIGTVEEPDAEFRNRFEDYPGTAFGITGNASGHPIIINDWRRVADIRLFYTN